MAVLPALLPFMLGPDPATALPPPTVFVYTVPGEDRSYTVRAEDRSYTVAPDPAPCTP